MRVIQNLTCTTIASTGIMETPEEYREAQVRKLFTALFTERARRILKILAVEYGLNLEELEARFIKPIDMVPQIISGYSVP